MQTNLLIYLHTPQIYNTSANRQEKVPHKLNTN